VDFLKKFAQDELKIQFDKKKPVKQTIIEKIIEKSAGEETRKAFKEFLFQHFSDHKLLTLQNLRNHASICQNTFSSDDSKEQLSKGINDFKRIYEIQFSSQNQFLFNCFIFCKYFGCVPVFYDKAIRTKNWNLRWATLKNSFKMFNNKPKYKKLISEHIFIFKYLYPKFYKRLIKRMWALKCETTEDFVACDEYLEMIDNKSLKKQVKVAKESEIKAVSTISTVSRDSVRTMEKILGRGGQEVRNSEKMLFSNVLLLEKKLDNWKPAGVSPHSLYKYFKPLDGNYIQSLVENITTKLSPKFFIPKRNNDNEKKRKIEKENDSVNPRKKRRIEKTNNGK